MRDFDKALEYNQKALNISKQMNDIFNIARSTSTLAWTYAECNLKSREKIIKMFEDSLVIYVITQPPNLMHYLHHQILILFFL